MRTPYEFESTYDICIAKMDDTHKNVANQLEEKMKEAGADMNDPTTKSEGSRLTDTLAILSVLGHEIDKLRMRMAVLEMERDGEHVNN